MFSVFKRVLAEVSKTFRQWSNDVKIVSWKAWNHKDWVYLRLDILITSNGGEKVKKTITCRFNKQTVQLVGNFDPRSSERTESDD
jgi:hypothetical protein